jgi:hypothetical protein
MQPQLAAHELNALSTTSVIRWEVQPFPAQTAAVGDGLRSVPSGMWTVTGTMQPR